VWICAFVVWPTAGFAGVAALLSPHGVLELRPDRHDGSTWHLFEAYAWNLADAVPVLKVSQTLNWREPLVSMYRFTTGSTDLCFHAKRRWVASVKEAVK
jgi:hypothetical protein